MLWRAASATSCVGRRDRAAGLEQPVDDGPEARPLAWVERRGRLVEQQHGGVGEQADRNVDALAVAAGQRRDGVVPALLKAGERQHAAHGIRRLGDLLELREQAQVLEHRQSRVDRHPLRHPADAGLGPLHGARVGPLRAGAVSSSVVFPAPLGPMIASASPRRTSRPTSLTATRLPNDLRTAVARRITGDASVGSCSAGPSAGTAGTISATLALVSRSPTSILFIGDVVAARPPHAARRCSPGCARSLSPTSSSSTARTPQAASGITPKHGRRASSRRAST